MIIFLISADGGLHDLLVDSGVYAGNTAELKNLTGMSWGSHLYLKPYTKFP
jgi:hypothetical protein